LASAATDLAGIGSSLNAANLAAAVPTTGVLAAGADQISAAVAALFAEHGQAYQALSAELNAFHQQFVQALSGAGSVYAGAEAANASRCRPSSKTCWARSMRPRRRCSAAR
jgi:hypothetical protein